MAEILPPDVSVILTVSPELNVEDLTIDTSNVVVTTGETPIVLNLENVEGYKGLDGNQGPQGEPGLNACTLSMAPFTVPPSGGTVTVPVEDTSWIVLGQFLYVESAGGDAADPGALKVVNKTATNITLQNISTSQATGPPGPPGTPGSKWYNGIGPPVTVSGAIPGDYYLANDSGEIYFLN